MPPVEKPSSELESARRRVLVSSVIGSVIEWYDYALYGTAAALIFSSAFFPEFSPAAGRVLGKHRYEVADLVVSSEAGEQGDADVHHTRGLRDHDRAPPEPRQPVPLAGVVPLDAVRLLLARIELPNRQQHAIHGV